MIYYSHYREQVNNLLPQNDPKTVLLAKTDVCTQTREYSRWVFIVSAVSYAASFVLNTPAVPTSITLASGIVWGASRYLSQSLEPQAKKIVAECAKKKSEMTAQARESQKKNEELVQHIHEMYVSDQNARFRLHVSKDMEYADELNSQIKQLKSAHLEKMKQIVQTYGWPGHSQVGVYGSHEFWLLVQHTEDVDFQEMCLGLLKEAVNKGEASKADLAYLTDRVLVNLKLPQMYGTQIVGDGPDFRFWVIENEEAVEERRKEMGLSTLAEYKAFIQAQYK